MSADIQPDIGRQPAFVGIMLTLCVIAVLLNLLVILAVVKFGRGRSSIDIFVSNLAVSDILHAGIVTPIYFKNVTVYHKNFYGGGFVCKLTMFIPLLSILGGTLTMVAISLDRYRMYVTKKQPITRRQALFVVALIWITAFLISSPHFYEYNVYEDADEKNQNHTYTACGSEGIAENFETIYASCVVTLAFLVPVLVLAICYTKVMIHVRKHSRRLRCTQSIPTNASCSTESITTTNRMVSAEKIRKLNMLILISTTFIALWTPYFIMFALTEITGTDDTAHFLEWPHVVNRTMTVLSTISNPLIYLVYSKTCRQTILDILTCTSIREPQVEGTVGEPSHKVGPANENWNASEYGRTDVIKVNI
ncbi:neuropeptide receptor 22-like [Ruditapes philippinarum]|uniref:neuropeptide receptor 22-like n=1 Tax=Ruditapes philippinarum TaxID=129788 RepID=UPI00295BBE86|nr:neuropeptide receptor 22-like [Ruditapes philippinarum]